MEDHADRPVTRWRPHPTERLPHNLSQVLEVLSDARTHISRIFEAGQVPLVVGGECTLAIALYSAAVSRDDDVALLYFDGGQDLSNDPDNPEYVLDGLGVRYLLDLPDTPPELAGFGPRQPLLARSGCASSASVTRRRIRTAWSPALVSRLRTSGPTLVPPPAGHWRRWVRIASSSTSTST